MTLRPILISLLSILVLVGTAFAVYSTFHRPFQHKLDADLLWVGVLDLDNSNDTNLHAIQNGDDGVLVVDHANSLYHQLLHKIPEAKYLTLEEVFNFSNLHLFDKDNDGKITSNDPIFQHLYVIKYHSKEPDEIKTLPEIGLKAIDVYHKSPTGHYIGHMEDGSQKIIISSSRLEKE